MVCHVSSYHRQSSSFIPISLLALFCTLRSLSPILPPSPPLAPPRRSLSSRRQMRSRRQGGSLGGSCPHIVATPPFNRLRPRPCALLHLTLFLSDSWQPVGYSGHCQSPLPPFSTTTLQHIFAKWLVGRRNKRNKKITHLNRSCALYRRTPWGGDSDTCCTHGRLHGRPRTFVGHQHMRQYVLLNESLGSNREAKATLPTPFIKPPLEATHAEELIIKNRKQLHMGLL